MGVQDAEVPHSQYQLVEEDIVPVVSAVPGGWGRHERVMVEQYSQIQCNLLT